jgi:tRNA (guanine37-N1)-methyltransferase
LLSGHHGKIKEWRQEMSEILTKTRRPDLWKEYMRNKKEN